MTAAPGPASGPAAAGEGSATWLRDSALLSVEDLTCTFRVPGGTVQAVSGVSFDLLRGETLGLVGESGCGKSTTGRAILQLPPPTSGSVRFEGRELTRLGRGEMRPVRRRLQMIFQDPVSALNPRRRVRDVVAEGLTIARAPKEGVAGTVDRMLTDVGMDPAQVGDRRPHEFSGGQAQRIAIARALAVEPGVLICDEPVASLDVSVQAQILNLLEEVKASHGLSMLFISHNLAVVHSISDRVAVMYLGKIVEIGAARAVYARPAHPYTTTLLDAVPVPDPKVRPSDQVLEGEVPSPLRPPSGCRFRTRCPRAQRICAEVEPPLLPTSPPADEPAGDGHHVACHFPVEHAPAAAAGAPAAARP